MAVTTEYLSGGRIQGRSDDSEPANTTLTFTATPDVAYTGNSFGNETRTIAPSGTREGVGEKIESGHYLENKAITKVSFFMKLDQGSPQGTVKAYIRDSDGSVKTQSSTTYAATVFTSVTSWYDFEFTSTTIDADDIICIELDNLGGGSGGSSNSISIRTNNKQLNDDGLLCQNVDTSSDGYATISGESLVFIASKYTTAQTFTPAASATINYVVVGGGGGGARDNYSGQRGAGGGGSGAYKESGVTTSNTAFTSANTAYTINVGTGGFGGGGTSGMGGGTLDSYPDSVMGGAGMPSSISGSGLTTIYSDGGSGGGGHDTGGNSGAYHNGSGSTGGASNNTTSHGSNPSDYGKQGGAGGSSPYSGGGGGGASGVGAAGSGGTGGIGGTGRTPSTTYFTSSAIAGGGGGNGANTQGTGTHGGGTSSQSGSANAGTVNSGAGGGASRGFQAGAGGSGVVIISFPVGTTYSATGTYTIGSAGSVDKSKTSITNVPVGTRYEETDTRKIFRCKDGGYDSGLGSTSDWTVALNLSTDTSTATPTNFPTVSWSANGTVSAGSTGIYMGAAGSGTGAGAQIFPANSDFTISTWIRPSIYDTYCVLRGNDDPSVVLYVAGGGGAVEFFVYKEGGTASSDKSGGEVSFTFTAGNWYHIVGTYDESNGYVKCYVNNVIKVNDTGGDAAGGVDAQTDWRMFSGSASNSTNNEFFGGNCMETAIWNKILTDNERYDLYTGGSGGSGGSAGAGKLANTIAKTNIVCYWNGSDYTASISNLALGQEWVEKGTA